MSDARRSERRSSRLAKRKPPPGAGRKPTGAGEEGELQVARKPRYRVFRREASAT
jgi:hypothetical protein